jgi:hypothetical protein
MNGNKYSWYGFIYVSVWCHWDGNLDGHTVGRSALPQQLICQPSICPLLMSVLLVPYFIETTPRFRKCESSCTNICRIIVHSTRANTCDFMRPSIDINFLFWVSWRFYGDTYLFRHFPRIIRDRICLHNEYKCIYTYVNNNNNNKSPNVNIT